MPKSVNICKNVTKFTQIEQVYPTIIVDNILDKQKLGIPLRIYWLMFRLVEGRSVGYILTVVQF